jgi:hypothetical protein
MGSTILLTTGDRLEVQGTVEDAAKALENATRSSAGTLAWMTDAVTGETVAVNPLLVVTVRTTPGAEADSG